MHYAAQTGRVLLVDILVKLGAKVDGVNKVSYNVMSDHFVT